MLTILSVEPGSPYGATGPKQRFVNCEPGVACSCFTNYDPGWRILKSGIGMRIISKSRLRTFWEMPACGDSEGPLRAWFSHVGHRSVAWQTWADVKGSFGSASLVGDCVVFNVGGNKYRLITRVWYPSQKVFILKVMTHKEYDEGKWKDECGCFIRAPEPRPRSTPRHPKRGG
jgi:mRNA interferase HigB